MGRGQLCGVVQEVLFLTTRYNASFYARILLQRGHPLPILKCFATWVKEARSYMSCLVAD